MLFISKGPYPPQLSHRCTHHPSPCRVHLTFPGWVPTEGERGTTTEFIAVPVPDWSAQHQPHRATPQVHHRPWGTKCIAKQSAAPQVHHGSCARRGCKARCKTPPTKCNPSTSLLFPYRIGVQSALQNIAHKMQPPQLIAVSWGHHGPVGTGWEPGQSPAGTSRVEEGHRHRWLCSCPRRPANANT